MTAENKFTHPEDAPEGHKWVASNGWPVTSVQYFTDAKNSDYPIAAVVNGAIELFDDNGEFNPRVSDIYLIDAPRTRTVWVNLYPDGMGTTYRTKCHADAVAGSSRIACKRVDLTEGEFD